ncbi:DUF6344 domain-containing protein [Streptomyces chiangmaiensis]|uniref:DUF6344 domain-containing protein n=1 Tax=Streptomyces chiangmaiensis TaxID=766497 RepID=A0ABU7F9R0_9ACTN|nr:DUF6344 domain-containing protein [Streptomyces chiangmaiensis]MED7820922.1 DUF6344 domain-containing protein [Streptomyces chiangmaiensis]
MTGNKVMKLWNAVVTAFLAVCTALGLIKKTAAAAVPQPQPERNSGFQVLQARQVLQVTLPRQTRSEWTRGRSLPPTMKQRIRAEAHGSSPSCRRRTTTGTVPAIPVARSSLQPRCEPATATLEPTARLQC